MVVDYQNSIRHQSSAPFKIQGHKCLLLFPLVLFSTPIYAHDFKIASVSKSIYSPDFFFEIQYFHLHLDICIIAIGYLFATYFKSYCEDIMT